MKLKLDQQEAFTVGGYRLGPHGVDALLVGSHEGEDLRLAGAVGAALRAHSTRGVMPPMQISRRCDEQELAAFWRYQSSASNTWLFVEGLLNAGVPVFRASVAGLTAIGELQTFFKKVGRTTAQSRHGTLRFRVAQVVQLLEDPELVSTDPELADMRRTVHRYAKLFESGASSPQVTIFVAADISLLLDGNKTTLAAYLHSKCSSQPEYVLDMYCLHAPQYCGRHLLM